MEMLIATGIDNKSRRSESKLLTTQIVDAIEQKEVSRARTFRTVYRILPCRMVTAQHSGNVTDAEKSRNKI